MTKQIDFIKARNRRKSEADEIRAMLLRIEETSDKTQEEQDRELLEELKVLDPEAAKMWDEWNARCGNAFAAEMREAGFDIPGNEFEIRRDENDLYRSRLLEKEIMQKLRESQN